MTNHPSFAPSSGEPRYMAYDGEGVEVGCLTLSEAQERFASAVVEKDEETGRKTITVERDAA